ncbi:O-antigen ligase family protein (plasmid) [Sphingomonadaceae bacterium OTU29MARTA1]|nr:O-antigen ligase family protein [Sphingomonadaceae bacterium OTU29MARTA1]
MNLPVHSPRLSKPSLAFVLLVFVVGMTWIAGGASRPDASGQAVVRAVAWVGLMVAMLGGVRSSFGQDRNVTLLLGAVIIIVLVQLVPLPPTFWQALPSRAIPAAVPIRDAATLWRPLSLVPSATLNAAMSLIVPAAVLLLASALRPQERDRLTGMVLGLVVLAMLLGVLQVSGAGVTNPFAGASQNEVSGPFANRNHFALFLAIGCLIAPVWAFAGDRQPPWRGGLCLGLMPLFVLMILATGSRAGLLLGTLGLGFGVAIARQGIRRRLRRMSRRTMIGIVAAIATMLLLAIMLSIMADRAVSIDRVFEIDAAQDMRRRGLPVVLKMITIYFPAGTGFGGFDPIFRLNEPDVLLKPTYFNHAHNDFLEVVLDGGLLGLLLLVTAVAWWVWASIRAWRAPVERVLPRLGGAILLLVFFASAFDYPARTPLIMVIVVLGAMFLNDQGVHRGTSALPREDQQL